MKLPIAIKTILLLLFQGFNPTDGVDDGRCSKNPVDGWYSPDGRGYLKWLRGSESPNGFQWQWEECAGLCADNPECNGWTVRNQGDRACLILDQPGGFNQAGGHYTGLKDLDCGKVTPRSATLSPSTVLSSIPSHDPTLAPSSMKSSIPSTVLSSIPSHDPTLAPSSMTSSIPSTTPSMTLPGVNNWFMSDAFNVTHEITSSDIIAIKLPFNTSNRELGVEVFKNDCITSFDSAEHPYFITDMSAPTSSQPDGFIQFNTTLELNVTAINGTNYWTAFTDGTRGGWVEACVETSLIFEDNIDLGNAATPQKVNFKNNILNISVSLTASYEVEGLNVERETATEERIESDYSGFITAYECDEGNLYTPKTAATYNQGEEITICITDESIDIVQVEQFVNLIVDQSDNTPYNFISNGLWNPDITTTECVDGSTSTTRRVCYAKIRALARFFLSENPSDLFIRGNVFVLRDGHRVMRKLRNVLPVPDKTNDENNRDASSRRVQGSNGNGKFELTVGLTNTGDSATSNGMVEMTAISLMSMAVGAAGVAGLALLV